MNDAEGFSAVERAVSAQRGEIRRAVDGVPEGPLSVLRILHPLVFQKHVPHEREQPFKLRRGQLFHFRAVILSGAQYRTVIVLQALQQKASALARRPSSMSVSFTKPSACFAF